MAVLVADDDDADADNYSEEYLTVRFVFYDEYKYLSVLPFTVVHLFI